MARYLSPEMAFAGCFGIPFSGTLAGGKTWGKTIGTIFMGLKAVFTITWPGVSRKSLRAATSPHGE
jgi:hypothetical protein